MNAFKDDIEPVIANIAASHANGVDQDQLQQQITDLVTAQVAAKVAPIQASIATLQDKVSGDEGASDETKAAVTELQGVVEDLANAVNTSLTGPASPSPAPAPAPAPAPQPAPAPAA